MKTVHFIQIVGFATVAALGGAAYYMWNQDRPVAHVRATVPAPVPKTYVLVSANPLSIGTVLTAGDMKWQEWPASAEGDPNYMTQRGAPGAIQEWTGSVVRVAFAAGEPIRVGKLIKAGTAGFLSAMLPAGMRAVTVKISVNTAAGGFIQPNDRVDVILVRRDGETTQMSGQQTYISSIILPNVRVLAIDQAVQDSEGDRINPKATTATLALTPSQAQDLAVANEMGSLSLALRPLADGAVAAANADMTPVSASPASLPVVVSGGTAEPEGLAVVRYGTNAPVSNKTPR